VETNGPTDTTDFTTYLDNAVGDCRVGKMSQRETEREDWFVEQLTHLVKAYNWCMRVTGERQMSVTKLWIGRSATIGSCGLYASTTTNPNTTPNTKPRLLPLLRRQYAARNQK